jgi:hypothetical protein
MLTEHCRDFEFKVIVDPDNEKHYPKEWIWPLSREIVWTDVHASRISNSTKMVLNRCKPQGCWGKLDAFLPSFSKKPTIILDLDIVILDDLFPLFETDYGMPVDREGHFNGSVYLFHPGEHSASVYPTKIPYRQYPRGEQEFAADRLKPQVLPDCYSYKAHIASRSGKQPPPGTRIVFFHGYPTPASPSVENINWVNRTWRGLDKHERV